jgi:hypothetical protein
MSKTTRPLFAGLAYEPPIVRDYIPREEKVIGLPAPATRPSMRPASRHLAQVKNVLKPDSAFRTLSMDGDACEFRPLTRTEGAQRLGITPEHVAERKPFPLLDDALQPRVRTKNGAVPKGCRATPGARNTTSKDSFGKPQPSAPLGSQRSKSVEKVAYSRGKGMTAKKVISRAEQDRVAEMAAQQRYADFQSAEMADREAAQVAREAARVELHAAMGRKRDALAQRNTERAATAQREIRTLRKLAAYKEV